MNKGNKLSINCNNYKHLFTECWNPQFHETNTKSYTKDPQALTHQQWGISMLYFLIQTGLSCNRREILPSTGNLANYPRIAWSCILEENLLLSLYQTTMPNCFLKSLYSWTRISHLSTKKLLSVANGDCHRKSHYHNAEIIRSWGPQP